MAVKISAPHVLVVDDDAAILQLFHTLFLRAGFVVMSASDGQKSWDLIENADYEVIILDLMMPLMSGFELLERIGSEKPDLPGRVIVTTGVSSQQLRSFDASRVHSLIRKPFDIDELLSAAGQCVGQHARDSC